MIGKLKGRVDELCENYIIMDLSGVGYLIFVSEITKAKLQLNQELTLLIETHVREDHIHLFGFVDHNEKKAFSVLQSVSGIGVKMALHILSYISPQNLQAAIDTKDKGIFKNISGIGSKLAERILLELKNKDVCTIKAPYIQRDTTSSDAIKALIGLGLTKQDASQRVQNILEQKPELVLDELIMAVLKK